MNKDIIFKTSIQPIILQVTVKIIAFSLGVQYGGASMHGTALSSGTHAVLGWRSWMIWGTERYHIAYRADVLDHCV